MALPDPTSIDWTSIAGWGAGVALVVTSVVVTIWRAIGTAGNIAKDLPATTTATKIVTADTVAMDRLAGTVEASNATLVENNLLRREEHNDRAANRASLEANTAAMERLGNGVTELRQDIRDLTREIVRSNRP